MINTRHDLDMTYEADAERTPAGPGAYAKGLLMGLADLIPGISGGTIALILGIYVRFITAADSTLSYLASSFAGLFRRIIVRKDVEAPAENFINGLFKADFLFLITVFAGILSAMLIGSKIMSYLLENYTAMVLSFFIGLIVASTKVIYDRIETHSRENVILGIVGATFGLTISLLAPVSAEPALPYVFLGGFFAVSAMFLPGISGAFILLIMGLYAHMVSAVGDIGSNLHTIFVFSVGALLGATIISKLIGYLLRKDRCKTLYFLLGLVIGALYSPIDRIVDIQLAWDISHATAATTAIVAGIFSVYLMHKIGSKQ